MPGCEFVLGLGQPVGSKQSRRSWALFHCLTVAERGEPPLLRPLPAEPFRAHFSLLLLLRGELWACLRTPQQLMTR